MKSPAIAFCLLAAGSTAQAKELDQERALLKEDPARAVAVLQQKLFRKPSDPWLLYNTAVAAYAANNFTKANELWQQLSSAEMPEELKDKVWMQIGNVSYRLVQPQIETEPEVAVPGLEQSREALKVAVNFNKQNQTAAKNLKFIESVLEKLYARLSKQLVEEAKKEPSVPEAVEKLETALPYAQQALELNPTSEQRKEEKKEVEKLLSEKLQERGAEAEERGDQRQPERNQWEEQAAKEEYEKSLADFQQAKALTPENKKAEQGEKRVEEKLANLHDKAGRKEQRLADALAEYRPDQAMEQYQKALENFEEAQSIQPEHADAKAGEKEVREAMEKLHLAAGDKQLERGEQQVENNPEAAVENLQQALENFEAAKALDPQNAAIPPRIDKANALMPQALTKLGQQEMQQGEGAEQQGDNQEAMENYEQAEQNFADAQGMQPGNKPAQQGQQAAQAAMARLQGKNGQMAQQQGQQQQNRNSNQPQQPRESFASMLARVKEEEKYREAQARYSRGQRYNEQRDTTLRNW